MYIVWGVSSCHTASLIPVMDQKGANIVWAPIQYKDDILPE